jgi:hypothetical protein
MQDNQELQDKQVRVKGVGMLQLFQAMGSM